jgi:CHAT domain-containing protein/tetratricopeptide (TPR) repeat protein
MLAQHHRPIDLPARILTLVICVTICVISALGARENPWERKSISSRNALQNTSSGDKVREQAMKCLAAGENLRAEWKEQALREAISQYTDATVYCLSIGSSREAAEALESVGELQFILSEYYLALKSYEKALAIRQIFKDELGIAGNLDRTGYTYIYLGQNQRALVCLERASSHLNKLLPLDGYNERLRIEAQLQNSFGEVYYSLSDVKKALDCFNRALNLWKAAGDLKGEALADLNMGYMYHNFGDLKGAEEYYDQSLALWIAAGDKRGEALTRTAMGGIRSFLGEQQKALELHNEALNIFRFIGDRRGEAATLNGIGTAYEGLNKPQEALDNYDHAMRLYHAIGNRDYEALARFYIGAVHRSLGATERALYYYNQSISMLRRVRDQRIETYVLRDLASIYNSSGQTRKALSQYRRVLNLYRGFRDKRGQANTVNSIADIYASTGKTQRALGLYERALGLVKAAQDRGAEISTLYKLACAERDVGEIGQALSRMDESIQLIEGLRVKAGGSDLRASYFASVHRNYEQYVDLLMNMEARHPSGGFAATALYANERSHARSLLEMLAEARVDFRRDADPELAEHADFLERSLDAKAEYQMRVLSGNHSKDDGEAIEQEIRELGIQYEEVQTEIRKQSVSYATLTQPKLLRLRDIQSELGDSNTLLLEYALGEERSYLWAVTSDSFASYTLPGRSTLEIAAQEVYALLTTRQPKNNETQLQYDERVAMSDLVYSSKATALSRMLLGPAVTQLGKRRLIIVADGALQYIPFEILPVESSDRREETSASPFANQGCPERMATLVTEHEVVYLQSASMLAALRQEKGGLESRQQDIVVLADPVFTRDDPRVPLEAREEGNQGIPEIAELQRSLRDISGQGGDLNFSRLPSTLEEARSIVQAAPLGSTLLITGFQASKSAAMSGALGQHKIVHFATHGLINNEHPQLSGIVLSLIDQRGSAQSGFLRLRDIYKLHVDADLVVLSACRSGLGKQINGEGFVGLTRGFMCAGARSVIASLWKVDDEATAELMRHLYDAMLREHLPPAAALQQAKQAMQIHPRWRYPYYWAGFVLQGDYREGIRISRSGATDALVITAIVVGLGVGGFYVRTKMKRRHRSC